MLVRRLAGQGPFLVLFVALVLSVGASLWLPDLVVPLIYHGGNRNHFNKLVYEYRKGILELCWGFILIYGLSHHIRRERATDELQKTVAKTLDLTREGQITDRMIKAVSQLAATNQQGVKQVELRLGGIFALERIARESPDDHRSVMEILSAYVRHNLSSNISSYSRSPEDEDIHAVLAVLGRRRHKLDGTVLNLRGIAVPGADLRGSHFIKADLSEACLERSSLAEASLEGATLVGTILEGSQMGEANLDGANMAGANLNGATAYRAQLQRAELTDAHLQRTVLIGANLRKADLTRACLQGAKLGGAHLEGALLVDARMEDADLSRSFLQGANLTGAVGLTQEQIDSAFGDGTTQLPSGINCPPYWSDSTVIVPFPSEARSSLIEARAKGTARGRR